MAHHGQADSYYNPGPEPQGYNQYGNQGGGYPPPQQQQQQQGYETNYQQPQGQPQYTQAPPNYQTKHEAVPYPQTGDGKQDFAQTFKIEKPKFNDAWAAILLILVFFAFAAVSGLAIHGYAQNHSGSIYGNSNTISLNSNTIILFAFVLGVALVLSWGYFMLARAFTKQFIWITGILNLVFALATAIYYLYRKQYSAGIVFLIFAAFAIFCFISWIPRIPFSALMLRTCMDVARGYGHVFLVSAVGGFIALAFAAWFSVTLVAVYVQYQPVSNSSSNSVNSGGASNAKVIGLIVFITFAGYWITEFIKNVMHTIIAGVYGSWFFCAGKPGGMPRGATRGATKRALTYSFGSISFGSLIVAIINLLRQACSIAQSQEGSQGNMFGAAAFCCLQCILGLVEWAVQFINRYAFSHIALYGKAYIPAAKDTWTMMKDRGIDALVNDCLIGPVLTMGSAFVGYACALLAYLYLEFTKPEYNASGTYYPVVMAFAFLAGLQIAQIFLTPIASGVDTIFVAAAWDPQVLVMDHAELYGKMVKVYPRVQTMIHA